MTQSTFALLDDLQHQQARLYQHFVVRQSFLASQIDALDSQLEAGFKRGWYCTVRIPYEFGTDLQGLSNTGSYLQLDWYQTCELLDTQQVLDFLPNGYPSALFDLQLFPDATTVHDKITQIQEAIRCGQVYQVNYTGHLTAQLAGCPQQLYRQLRTQQATQYASLMYHPDDGYTLCLSPELFLEIDDQHITAKPMKGTALAGNNPQQASYALQQDSKNRAENTMIVDLLRNDLSQLAQPFQVKTSALFHVEQFNSILQMTSTVEATLPAHTSCADILRATFPCGSITGAPKRMAMHYIQQLEPIPRGIYTGSIGYIEPKNEGYKAVLNVAIRTLNIRESSVTMGVGSGITISSQAEAEYQEWLMKTNFLHHPFGLLETMRLEHGVIQRLALHLQRLASSAADLGIVYDHQALQQALHEQCTRNHQEEAQIIKVHVHPQGQFHITTSAIHPIPSECAIYPQRLPIQHRLRRYKIDQRQFLDQIWQQDPTLFDQLLFNTQDELLEGARSNVFIVKDHHAYTPPLEMDILNGVMRQHILQHPTLLGVLQITEQRLTLQDVFEADQIYLSNSVRGVVPVTLRPSQST